MSALDEILDNGSMKTVAVFRAMLQGRSPTPQDEKEIRAEARAELLYLRTHQVEPPQPESSNPS